MKKSLIQILLPAILFFGLLILQNFLYEIYPMKRLSIPFGITTYYSWVIFGILLLIFNIYIIILRKNEYVIGVIFFLISITFPLEAITIRPFRIPLMIIMFLSGFSFSIIISQLNYNKEKLKFKILNYKL